MDFLKRALIEIKEKPQRVGETREYILKLLQQDSELSAAKIEEKIGLSSRQIERMIKRLKEEGKIVRHGSDRGGYWEVIDKR